MPLVPAKCPNCGGVLDVDPSHDAAVCSHCGTPFITEKAINNYNITNVANYNTVNNISGGEIHIHTAENDAPKRLLRNVFAGIKQNNFDITYKNKEKLEEKYPESPEYLMSVVLNELDFWIKEQDVSLEAVGFCNLEKIVEVKKVSPELFNEYYPYIIGRINDTIYKNSGKKFGGDLPVLKAFFQSANEEEIERHFVSRENGLKSNRSYNDKDAIKKELATLTSGDLGEDEEYLKAVVKAVVKAYAKHSFDLDGKAKDIYDAIVGRIDKAKIAEYAAEAEKLRKAVARRAEIENFFIEYRRKLTFNGCGEAKKMLDNARGIPVKFELAKYKKTLFSWKYTGSASWLLNDFVDAAMKEDEENK